MYHIEAGRLKVLLAHPGGPFHARKDAGHWTIPKGEPCSGEDLLFAAHREFQEETGLIAKPPYIELGAIQQKGGKWVHAWGCEGELPPEFIHRCNTFRMEWPPTSGKFLDFPEIDKVYFFDLEEAREKIKPAQLPLIERLVEKLRIQA
jgi:predicted NUDIX family NTP pyrophosphohydrolase